MVDTRFEEIAETSRLVVQKKTWLVLAVNYSLILLKDV